MHAAPDQVAICPFEVFMTGTVQLYMTGQYHIQGFAGFTGTVVCASRITSRPAYSPCS